MLLLLGGSGMLGRELVRIMKSKHIDFLAPSRVELDLLSDDFSFLENKWFDRIIYAGAWTDVDGAEKLENQKMVWETNVGGLGRIMERLPSVPIVHVSTDYIFGESELGFEIPTDYPQEPLNYYGKTKFEAEKLLELSDTPWANIRTSWLYSQDGERDFFSKISQKLNNGEVVNLVDDTLGRPTDANDLASAIVDKFVLAEDMPTGHFHFQSAGERVSPYGVICARFPEFQSQIEPIGSSELFRAANRPKNGVLEISDIFR